MILLSKCNLAMQKTSRIQKIRFCLLQKIDWQQKIIFLAAPISQPKRKPESNSMWKEPPNCNTSRAKYSNYYLQQQKVWAVDGMLMSAINETVGIRWIGSGGS